MKEFKKCSIEGCENPLLARGLCQRHYNQTEKVKNKQKEYSKTEKGRATKRRKQKKWLATEAGRFARDKYRKSEKGLEKNRQMSHKRRLRVETLSSDSFTSLDVFQRDNWICCLCGEEIDKKLKFPHPRAATLEHLTPLSRGGTHTLENVSCAHFSCNAQKQAKTLEEYRVYQSGLKRVTRPPCSPSWRHFRAS